MSNNESLMLEILKQIQHELILIKQDVRDIKQQNIATHHRIAALDNDKSRHDENMIYIQDRLDKIEKRLEIGS